MTIPSANQVLDCTPGASTGTVGASGITDASGSGNELKLPSGGKAVPYDSSPATGQNVAVLPIDFAAETASSVLQAPTYSANLSTGISGAMVFDMPATNMHRTLGPGPGIRDLVYYGVTLQLLIRRIDTDRTGKLTIVRPGATSFTTSNALAQRNVLCWASDNTSTRIWLNGTVTTSANAGSGSAQTGLRIGANWTADPNDTNAFFRIYRALSYTGKMADATLDAMGETLASLYNVPVAPTKALHLYGDSIEATFEAANLRGWTHVSQLTNRYQRVYNWAGAGEGFSGMETTAEAGGVQQLAIETGATTSLLIGFGSNDIAGGQTAAAVWANISAFIDERRLEGIDGDVFVCTVLPRSDVITTEETARLDLNALIRSNAASKNYKVIDFAGITALQDPTDTTYYSTDEVHPNETGHALMAALADSVTASSSTLRRGLGPSIQSAIQSSFGAKP